MFIALSGEYIPSLKQRLSNHHETVELTAVIDTPQAANVTMLVTRGKLKVDAALLDRLPSLRKIVKAGSGLDTIDVVTARQRGVQVVATGGSGESVADLAMGLLFSCLRHVLLFDDAVRKGDWNQKARLVGNTVASRRIGVVGFGSIGQLFGAMSRALGADVCAWDRSIAAGGKEELLRNMGIAPSTSLRTLIQASDVISLHLPLQRATTSLIGRDEFSAMEPGTVLINTSRAAIVEREALIDALTNGVLSSAGLDVHYNENQATAEPLFDLSNVVLTPHVGAQSHQAQQSIAEKVLTEVVASSKSDDIGQIYD